MVNENSVERQTVTVEQKQLDLQKDLVELIKRPALGAMSVLPKEIEFETKDKEEQVVLVLRRHLVTNLPWFLGSIALVLIPFLALAGGIFPEVAVRYRWLLILLWMLLIFGYALEKFLVWFFNVYIVTNERIVDIDFHNLLYREISDADLDKIQDMTIRGSGVAAAFFHYGDVIIQTAAETQMFEFHAVPHPELVSKVIRELIEYNELYNN